MGLVRPDVERRVVAPHAAVIGLAAESIGCRVPRAPGRGRVEAVFQRACNVALDGGGMLAVLVKNASNVPHGVRLTCSPRLDRTLHVRMPVRISRDRIVFAGGAVIATLDGASTWTPDLKPGLCTWHSAAIGATSYCIGQLRMRAKSSSSDVLRALLTCSPVDTPLAMRFGDSMPVLSRSMQTGNAAAALTAIARLIGLGAGLTPAGDDFVVGWLAGLTLTAATREQIAFLHAVCDGLAVLQDRTTPISWQHLDDARALMFSERLADLCAAIAAGAPAPVLEARLDAQLAVGASSGADAAAGLLLALRESYPPLQALFPKPTH